MKSEVSKIRSISESVNSVINHITESPSEVNKLVAELDKKYHEKFKVHHPDDLTMVYASKCGVMGSFLTSALQRLEQVAPKEYEDLIKRTIK